MVELIVLPLLVLTVGVAEMLLAHVWAEPTSKWHRRTRRSLLWVVVPLLVLLTAWQAVAGYLDRQDDARRSAEDSERIAETHGLLSRIAADLYPGMDEKQALARLQADYASVDSRTSTLENERLALRTLRIEARYEFALAQPMEGRPGDGQGLIPDVRAALADTTATPHRKLDLLATMAYRVSFPEPDSVAMTFTFAPVEHAENRRIDSLEQYDTLIIPFKLVADQAKKESQAIASRSLRIRVYVNDLLFTEVLEPFKGNLAGELAIIKPKGGLFYDVRGRYLARL